MLIFDRTKIGNKLLAARKSMGFTQGEVAERAGLADRTYADIERGTVNMRIDTLLHICEALNVTPDEILTERPEDIIQKEKSVFEKFNKCTDEQKMTTLNILSAYLNSL